MTSGNGVYLWGLRVNKKHQLRAKKALSVFNDVQLRARRALSLYKVYGDSALLVLGTYNIEKC